MSTTASMVGRCSFCWHLIAWEHYAEHLAKKHLNGKSWNDAEEYEEEIEDEFDAEEL